MPMTGREVECHLREMAEGLVQKRWSIRTVIPRLQRLAADSGRSESFLRNALTTWCRDLERSPWA